MAGLQPFSDIDLDYAVLGGRVYPKINIIDMSIPYAYAPGVDFFELEKYVINPLNSGEMAVMENVLVGQITLYYMSGTSYMSSYIWMADSSYDLGTEPQRFNVAPTFQAGVPYLVDTDTDISRYLYIYRLTAGYQGWEWASQYVAGIRDIPMGTINTTIDEFLGEVMFSTREGIFISREGSLYRTTRHGTIITKGLPFPDFNRRYRGPIEPEKENASRRAIARTLDELNSWIDSNETAIAGVEDDLTEFGEDLAAEVYGRYLS